METVKKYDLRKEINAESLLSRRYEQLLHSEKYYDCVFHVCGKFVRCHKLILCAASPVFEAMFFGPLQAQEQEIDILDISAEVFQIFINYIYTGNVDYNTLSLAETIELHYTAEKYLLDALNADCLKIVKQKLRFGNILPALDLSVRMDLDKLREICLNFLQRCCLTDAPQFNAHLQHNYVHVSKQCIKALLTYCKNEQIQIQRLMWFVSMWCQQQCLEYNLQQTACDLLLDELQLVGDLQNLNTMATATNTQGVIRERAYFKATRPFCISAESSLWKLQIQTNRFVRLLGITMHSRLKPLLQLAGSLCTNVLRLPDDYIEQLSLEINCLTAENDNDVIWRHNVLKRQVKYNCDVNLSWEATGVVLSPDLVYELTINWPDCAIAAEYPCSLFSDIIDGICVRDNMTHTGSLIKGLRFSDLV